MWTLVWDWLLTPLAKLFEAINGALEWEADDESTTPPPSPLAPAGA
jgi:hypothetical protein